MQNLGVQSQEQQLFKHIKHKDLTKVEQLITAGVDLNTLSKKGYSPLGLALASENTEMIKLLSSSGAKKVCIEHVEYKTPLHFYLENTPQHFPNFNYSKYVKIAQMLLEYYEYSDADLCELAAFVGNPKSLNAVEIILKQHVPTNAHHAFEAHILVLLNLYYTLPRMTHFINTYKPNPMDLEIIETKLADELIPLDADVLAAYNKNPQQALRSYNPHGKEEIEEDEALTTYKVNLLTFLTLQGSWSIYRDHGAFQKLIYLQNGNILVSAHNPNMLSNSLFPLAYYMDYHFPKWQISFTCHPKNFMHSQGIDSALARHLQPPLAQLVRDYETHPKFRLSNFLLSLEKNPAAAVKLGIPQIALFNFNLLMQLTRKKECASISVHEEKQVQPGALTGGLFNRRHSQQTKLAMALAQHNEGEENAENTFRSGTNCA